MRPRVFPQESLDDVAAFDQGLDTRGRRNNPLIVIAKQEASGESECGLGGWRGRVGEFNGFS